MNGDQHYEKAFRAMENVGRAMADELGLTLKNSKSNVRHWIKTGCKDHDDYVQVKLTIGTDNEIILRVFGADGTASMKIKAPKRFCPFELDLLGCHKETGRIWMEKIYQLYEEETRYGWMEKAE